MLRDKTHQRSFRIQNGTFGDAYAYVENLLDRKDINKEMASEALLVFEALMQKLIDWGLDEDTDLEISRAGRLGDIRIKIGFDGRMFTRDAGAEDSIEDRILDAHDDKLDYSYYTGYNIISISVSRSYRTSMLVCAISALCAFIVYLPLSFLLDAGAQRDLLQQYIFPLEKMYTNALLMIGAPMTFFSLLKNLTSTYIVSQKNSGIRRLQMRTLATSAFAILLALVAFFAISGALSGLEGSAAAFGGSFKRTFADVVTSSIPPSIFEPFEAISPIPLMFVALLCTYAMCSSGKYFATLRRAMMAGYTLFSRMLHVVIAVLPAFCFAAIMDVLLDTGIEGIGSVLSYLVTINVGILLLFATYAIRLRARGIKVVPFVRKLIPLLRENASIGSAINAAPYNIRYCARTFKMNRQMLERTMPVLAETNLDGNCFILMFFALEFVFLTSTSLSWLNLIGVAALVLFLSFGAPNQPGSILIGTLIITMYLNSPDVLCIAIYSEAFLGGAQNLINVIGDIVMAAIEDRKK